MTTPPNLAQDVADLQARVKGLARELGDLQQQFDQLTAATLGIPSPPQAAQPSAAPDTGSSSTSKPQGARKRKTPPHILKLRDSDDLRQALSKLATWVDDYFVPTYVAGRPLKPITPWCPEWWRHDEAIARLEALHLAYEELVDSPDAKHTDRAIWLVDHVDPMLAQLRSPTGPFVRCTTDPEYPKHTDPEPFLIAKYNQP